MAVRANPLLGEALRGLAGVGRAQQAYLNCLALQAVVLFLWWPKRGLLRALQHEDAPDTLLALTIALGLTLAYYAVRAGAEEFLLPGQQPLRDWTRATPLPVARLVLGYLAGHLMQMLHALALSLPLLLAAFAVAGGDAGALAWCLTGAVFQATFCRLAGVVMYLEIGHRGETTFFALRALVLAMYGVTAALVPFASHPRMSHALLTGSGTAHPLAFVALFTIATLVLVAALTAQLRRERRRVAVA